MDNLHFGQDCVRRFVNCKSDGTFLSNPIWTIKHKDFADYLDDFALEHSRDKQFLIHPERLNDFVFNEYYIILTSILMQFFKLDKVTFQFHKRKELFDLNKDSDYNLKIINDHTGNSQKYRIDTLYPFDVSLLLSKLFGYSNSTQLNSIMFNQYNFEIIVHIDMLSDPFDKFNHDLLIGTDPTTGITDIHKISGISSYHIIY